MLICISKIHWKDEFSTINSKNITFLTVFYNFKQLIIMHLCIFIIDFIAI